MLFGEQHGLKHNHDFRVALVQHSRFPEVVNDIVEDVYIDPDPAVELDKEYQNEMKRRNDIAGSGMSKRKGGISKVKKRK